MILVSIVIIMIGLFCVIGGILYDKKSHKNLTDSTRAVTDPIAALIIFILSLLPWYVMKTLFILLGLLFLVIAVLANI